MSPADFVRMFRNKLGGDTDRSGDRSEQSQKGFWAGVGRRLKADLALLPKRDLTCDILSGLLCLCVPTVLGGHSETHSLSSPVTLCPRCWVIQG